MDNLTHSLVGALVAEVAARCIPAVKSMLPATTRRTLFMTLMVVGSNLPDADLLYTSFYGGKLGYLLHHRGHTHTVLGAMAGGMLMFAVCMAWLKRQRLPSAPTDRLWLALLALFAPLLHIAMDAANSYGVHPFWPLNNDWMYGDSIFIVEPLFWASAAPLVFLLHGRYTRMLVAVILSLGIVLGFATGLVPRPMAAGLTLLTALLLFIGWRMSGRVAAMTGLSVAVAVFGMFVLTGHFARAQVATLATTHFADAVLLDAVLTPMPLNPLCWETILVQLHADEYTLRRAVFSLAPQWLPAEQCASRTLTTPTATDFRQVAVADSAALRWYGEVTMSRAELQSVIRDNCEAAALTRFARALWISRRDQQWLVGDLRFYSEAGTGLADLKLAPVATCPRHLPPWTPPRSDVLGSI